VLRTSPLSRAVACEIGTKSGGLGWTSVLSILKFAELNKASFMPVCVVLSDSHLVWMVERVQTQEKAEVK
jgi:hypothetical protein